MTQNFSRQYDYSCGNGYIKVNIWFVIPLCTKQVTIHMQLLASKTQARIGILFGKDASDLFVYWEDYHRRIVLIKQLSIPMVLQK